MPRLPGRGRPRKPPPAGGAPAGAPPPPGRKPPPPPGPPGPPRPPAPPGPGRLPGRPAPTGLAARDGIAPGVGRGPPAPGAGRGPPAPGAGRDPPAPGAGRGPPAPGAGRGPPWPGAGRDAGRAAGADEYGLLPTRGARGPGLGPPGPLAASAAGACGVAGAAGVAGVAGCATGFGFGAPGMGFTSATAGVAGASVGSGIGVAGIGVAGIGVAGIGVAAAAGFGPGRGPPGLAEPGVVAAGLAAPGLTAPGVAADFAAGACAAASLAAGFAVAALGASAAAAVSAGNDERSRRATGASTVDDADFTNSPWSFNRARTSLLVTPSSLANSCTRALPATALLTGEVEPANARTTSGYLRWTFIAGASRCAHEFSVCPSQEVVLACFHAYGQDRAHAPWWCETDVVSLCAVTHSRSTLRSRSPETRNALPNARRRSANFRHSTLGCNHAPRPGSRRAASGVNTNPGLLVNPEDAMGTATTLSRSVLSVRARHPTQVRTGYTGPTCVVVSSSCWAN